jgi:hypothetical protein
MRYQAISTARRLHMNRIDPAYAAELAVAPEPAQPMSLALSRVVAPTR